MRCINFLHMLGRSLFRLVGSGRDLATGWGIRGIQISLVILCSSANARMHALGSGVNKLL